MKELQRFWVLVLFWGWVGLVFFFWLQPWQKGRFLRKMQQECTIRDSGCVSNYTSKRNGLPSLLRVFLFHSNVLGELEIWWAELS